MRLRDLSCGRISSGRVGGVFLEVVLSLPHGGIQRKVCPLLSCFLSGEIFHELHPWVREWWSLLVQDKGTTTGQCRRLRMLH